MSHRKILELRTKLGYREEIGGTCHGFALRWIEASLLGSEEQARFEQRIKLITDSDPVELLKDINQVIDKFKKPDTVDLLKDINQVIDKVKKPEVLTEKDHELLDILAFYDSLELYQSPNKNNEMMKRSIVNQEDVELISQFASSDKIKARGGLKKILIKPVILDINETQVYLDHLAAIFESVSKNSQTPTAPISVTLGSHSHTTALNYIPGQGWQFRDINYPVKKANIVQQIFLGFEKNEAKYIAFNSSIITTGDDDRVRDLRNRISYLNKKSAITSEMAKRQAGSINLVHLATHDNGHELIPYFVQQGADLNHLDENDRTPAYSAALRCRPEVMQALADAGAQLNQADKKDVTPIFLALNFNHAEMMAILASKGVNLNQVNKQGFSLIFTAVYKGLNKAFQVLIDNKVNLNEQDSEGNTLLHVAAVKGYSEMIATLVDNGINVNQANKVGCTPAHKAAASGHIEALQALANKGADLKVGDDNGDTPAHLAAIKGHVKVVEFLVDDGINVNQANQGGETLISKAARHNHTEVILALVDKEADLNRADVWGRTPAHKAAANGHIEALQTLIDKGADLKVGDDDGNTPAHLAAMKGHAKVVEFLVDNGINVNQANKEGCTPAHKAAANGHIEALQTLIDKGADLKVGNDDGDTPAHQAAMNGHTKVVHFLIEKNIDLSTSNNLGDTLAHIAARKNNDQIIESLVKNDKKWLTNKNTHGMSLAYIAAESNSTKVIQYLLNNDIDFKSPVSIDKKILTPIADSHEFKARTDLLTAHLDDDTFIDQFSFSGGTCSDPVAKRIEKFLEPHSDTQKINIMPLEIAQIIGNQDAVNLINTTENKKIFLAKHGELFDSSKKTHFIGFFRKTEITSSMTLEQLIRHAQGSNNRSRKVCMDLGWMSKKGNLSELGQQILLNSVLDVNKNAHPGVGLSI